MFRADVKAESKNREVFYQPSNKVRVLLDDVDVVSDISYMKQRYSLLNYGFVEMTKLAPTRAAILASTIAHRECESVQVDIYVDQYDQRTDTWNQWRYWEYSADNRDHITKSMEIIVPSGHYYSLRGYHTCIQGNVIETAETITNGLYIGITDKPII